jgi:hypothetical protein
MKTIKTRVCPEWAGDLVAEEGPLSLGYKSHPTIDIGRADHKATKCR